MSGGTEPAATGEGEPAATGGGEPAEGRPAGEAAAAGPDEWRAPSPRLATMRRVEAAVGGVLFLALGAGLGNAFVGPAGAGGTAGGVLVLAAALHRFLQRRVASWGYLERSEDLLVRRGVLVQRLSVVPYGRMQFVDVTAGLAERSFGLATARLHTAAAASDARIPGLEGAEATRLRDRLAALGEAKAAGL
ncbi:MAG: PH domain-containing protein [Acidimicrobiales bacterium]